MTFFEDYISQLCFHYCVPRIQKKIPPPLNGPNKPKTTGKSLRIAPPDSKRDKQDTLYIERAAGGSNERQWPLIPASSSPLCCHLLSYAADKRKMLETPKTVFAVMLLALVCNICLWLTVLLCFYFSMCSNSGPRTQNNDFSTESRTSHTRTDTEEKFL